MIRKIERIFLLSLFLIISVCASAQSGTYGAYSPYSVFGVGNLSKEEFNKEFLAMIENVKIEHEKYIRTI